MKWEKAMSIAASKKKEGENRDALRYFKKALQIAQKRKSKKKEAKTLLFLGEFCDESMENYHDAIKYYEQGLAIAQEIGDKDLECGICRGLGNAYYNDHSVDQCAKFSKQALDIALRLGDSKLIAESYSSYGMCNLLSDYQNSVKCYKKAMDIYEQVGDEKGLGFCYTNLSSVYQEQGKFFNAIHCQEESLRIATQVCNKKMQAYSFLSLGNIYQRLNNPEKAADFYQQSLAIAKEICDRGLEQACYGNLGIICRGLKIHEEAISMYTSVLKIFEELDDKKSQAKAHMSIGNCFHDMQQYQDAVQHHNISLDIAKEINDKHTESLLYLNMAVLHHNTGQLEEAISMSNKALDIALSINDKETEYSIYNLLGSVHYLLGKTNPETHISKSKEYLQKALDSYDYLLTNLRLHDQFKISISDKFIHSYKLLTTILIETQQTKDALLVSDRGRARALGDRLTFAYGMSQEEYLCSKALTYPDVEKVCLNDAFTLLHYSLLDESLAVWVLTNKSVMLKQIDKEQFISAVETLYGEKKKKQEDTVQRLFADTVTRAYDSMKIKKEVTCENRSLDDCMTSTDQQCDNVTESAVSCDGTGGEKCDNVIESAVSRNGTGGEKVEPDLHPLQELYTTLIAPVLSDIQHDEIVIVADGKIYEVPFAALKDPNTGKYLSENKRIRLVPSIAVLKVLQECPVDHHSQQGALIVGNPSVGEVMFRGEKRTFSELDSAGIEVSCVSNLLEHAQLWNVNTTITSLTEEQATKDIVLAKMKEGVAIIHIAAHGDADHGEIVLAPITSQDRQGIPEEQDYLLTMKEVQEVGVKAQLVVLSCCHSGRGEIRAEGMIGLSRAFLAAGARAVVASLWAISDEVTLSFMISFYESLCKGNSASVSLDEAMKEVRSEPGHGDPKYWAPFFLIGDDVTINFGQ